MDLSAAHYSTIICMIIYIKFFPREENIIQKDIKQERSKYGTLRCLYNYTFPVTKSVAYSSALVSFGKIPLQKKLEDSESRDHKLSLLT